MTSEDDLSVNRLDPKTAATCYALKLGEGSEFAEFEPAVWRLTIFHILGVTREVTLGYAEAYLLEYLARHPGEILTRQQLLDHAWGDRVVSQGSLNQAISTLRALLGDDQKREIILTVPRRGYQFNSSALMDWDAWLVRKGEIQPSLDSPSLDDRPLPPRRNGWQIPALRVAAAILSLTLLGGLFTHYYYAMFPPYVSTESATTNTRLTLLAKNQAELDETREILLPIIDRLDALGGGRVLVNRTHNYLEFNCFSDGGDVHALYIHIRRLQTLEDNYLRGCLK
jgi:DNA-binding winged helix-turn-helix (wHTH) protein